MVPLSESRQGEISALCLMVERGKPSALPPIPSREIPAAYDWITRTHSCKAYFEYLYPGWASLWIHTHSLIFEVIRRAPREPRTTMDHWYLGKLFGYNDEAIEDYVNRQPLEFAESSVIASRARGKGIGVIVKADLLSIASAYIHPFARFFTGMIDHRFPSFLSKITAIANQDFTGRL